jgi:hypothetical protein
MKNTLKGKMVKTERPKYKSSEINCECISCGWEGDVEDCKVNELGTLLCPECVDQVIIYED